MQLPPLTRDQVRGVDRSAMQQFGLSGLVLMENAGRGAAEIIARVAPLGEIVILCGSGNNAGDGYVVARHLELLGRKPRILSIVDLDSLSGDAAVNAHVAVQAEIPCRRVSQAAPLQSELHSAATIVECLLGTGASGAPRGLFGDAIRQANSAAALRIAIDIPAGLDCDTGVASDPTLRADHTITFVAPKVGFHQRDAGNYLGVTHVVGIGAPQRLLDQVADSAGS